FLLYRRREFVSGTPADRGQHSSGKTCRVSAPATSTRKQAFQEPAPMPSSQPSAVLDFIRGQLAQTTADLSDREVLGRFAAPRDENAFKVLLARHGPLVWRACQRGLAQTADAEDVFQATFLVLARRAGALKSPETVGPWLYGVAHRLAQETRRKRLRQKALD